MIRITCTSCQKPLSLDETKLPMKEVSFPCPVCKAKIIVDRRSLEAGGGAEPQSATNEPMRPDDGADDHHDEFGEKALIVGADSPTIRQAAKLIGFLPIVQPDPARARDFFMQEYPHVVFINPPQLTPPPLESMAAIISLIPADRRRSFFILVADNLRTLDGNAAFLYGVNLVVATKDFAQFPQIYRDAYAAHERFYASVNAVTRERQSV